MIGPAASGLLLTAFDVVQGEEAKVVAIMAVTLSGLNMLLSWTLPETHPNPPARSGNPVAPAVLKTELIESLNALTLWSRLLAKDRQHRGLKLLVLMQLGLTFSTGYYFYFVTFISLGEMQMNARDISYFFIYFGGLSIVINYVFYTYIADRINQQRAIFWFALLGAPTLLAYAFVGKSYPMLYVIVTIDCLTLSLIQGLIEGLMAQRTTDEDRGEVFGINQALQGLASFLTTLIFGGLSLLDLRIPFGWFAACLFVVAWLAWDRQSKKAPAV